MFDMTLTEATILAYKTCVYTWMVTYVALIWRGVADRSYGMPIVALALNLTWEFTFFAVLTPYGSLDSNLVPNGAEKAQLVFGLCLLLDIGILYTYFRYGFRHFEGKYALTHQLWVFYSVALLLFSFLIIHSAALFFMQFDTYFQRDQIEAAKLIAFIQNAVMSLCFVAMFHMRNSIEGQSFTIAWTKFLGSSLTVGPIYLMTHPDNYFAWVVIGTMFLADLWYMILIWRALRKAGINPLTRF